MALKLLNTGVTLFTVNVNVVVVLPELLLAVTTYEVSADTTVGVPEIIPVVVSKTNPVGNAGLTLKPVAVPVIVGCISVIVLSFVNVWGRPYDKLEGAEIRTVIVAVTEVEQPPVVPSTE
jgi:hypothetical protein